jgi:predicted oxidoreductase
MERVKLHDEFSLSRIVHGFWRLLDWKMKPEELLVFVDQLLELGITSFDHADIYGNYACEQKFGEALRLKKSLRPKMQLITKCGIKLLSDKYPERRIKSYDYSYKYIVDSVERSLQNFGTDYLDMLMLHRPAPFYNPQEVAKAFNHLQKAGKVLHFGVSNFTPRQFELLDAYTEQPLVTNQIEISPYRLEHFANENIDFLLKNKIPPMAWSPLAGGALMHPQDEKSQRLYNTLNEIAEETEAANIAQVIYSWLLQHPARIIPITGSGKISRIKDAVSALDLTMTTEQWYRIYTASTGEEVP